MSSPSADPATTRDWSDPGDATLLNFRYQHTYGVILLASAKRGQKMYVALWCEHHEDFLAERMDGIFDGYQIKTSRPENGAWRMNDAQLVKSIGRFVDLVREFGIKIGDLFFVTNTEFDDIHDNHKDEKRRGRRPVKFLQHLRSCKKELEISTLYRPTFDELQGQCGCTSQELFIVLKKVNLILGPSRDSYLSVVSHDHLGQTPEWSTFSPSELDGWRDHLIATICKASSLAVTDPIRHLQPLIDATGIDPALAAKRLLVSEVMQFEIDPAKRFQFLGKCQLRLGESPVPHILESKLKEGGIPDQVEYLRERERATEAHLMEDAHREPTEAPTKLRQLEEIVLGACSESHLRARLAGGKYGDRMLIEIQDRLKKLAENESARVFHEPYDCLVGIVALLTSDTRVWFSSRFPVEESVT